jgi:trans-2,3-dihydro-3-hydroxyanthranilate isomerase
MPEYAYATVDVFTVDRFGGNPLAIVSDARGLSDGQMQAIAAEFNYSETTFVLPPENRNNTARVRIFTRTAEVPFAGHPNVGAGFFLGQQPTVFGAAVGSTMRFEEQAGLVEVELLRDAGGAVAGASITAPGDLDIGERMDATQLAKCLSLSPEGILTDHHAPTLASVGLPFFLAQTDIDTLATASPNLDAMAAAVKEGRGDSRLRLAIFIYARKGAGIGDLRARMFAPLGGTFEDPATGSASAALGAFLMSLDPRSDATEAIQIEQGVEMGRRSEIGVHVHKAYGRIESVRVSGRCVPVMCGTIEA